MQVKDIMTANVEMVPSDTTLRRAAERMFELDCGILPVSHEGQLQGVITDRDLVIRGLASGLDPDSDKVGNCLSDEIILCNADDDIHKAADQMERYQVRRLLVCNNEGQPVGIVSLGDFATEVGNRKLSGEILARVSEEQHAGARH